MLPAVRDRNVRELAVHMVRFRFEPNACRPRHAVPQRNNARFVELARHDALGEGKRQETSTSPSLTQAVTASSLNRRSETRLHGPDVKIIRGGDITTSVKTLMDRA